MKARLTAGVLAALITVVASFEGARYAAYEDPVGIPTICFGHIDGVRMGDTATPAECSAMLVDELQRAAAVLDCFNAPLTEGQQIAVTSWAYNVGTPAACRSTLVLMHNQGAPAAMWCAQLSRWTKARGITLPGLVKRRAEERRWCERA